MAARYGEHCTAGYFSPKNVRPQRYGLVAPLQGGVHLCKTAGEVRSKAVQMLGQRLITKQTGPAGLPCNVLYISETCPIASEMYLAITMGRIAGGPVMVASRHGGMDIEEVSNVAFPI